MVIRTRKDFIKQKEEKKKKNQGFDEEAVEPTSKTGGIVGQLVRVRCSARV